MNRNFIQKPAAIVDAQPIELDKLQAASRSYSHTSELDLRHRLEQREPGELRGSQLVLSAVEGEIPSVDLPKRLISTTTLL